MRSDAMATAGTDAGQTTRSSRAVNSNYRTSTEIVTRGGGIVWGFVLVFFGFLWFAATAGWISLGNVGNLILPFLVILAGLYLLVTKLMR